MGTQQQNNVPEYLISLFGNGTCRRAVRTNSELTREVDEFSSARDHDGVTVKSQRLMNVRGVCKFEHCGTPGNGGNETQQSLRSRVSELPFAPMVILYGRLLSTELSLSRGALPWHRSSVIGPDDTSQTDGERYLKGVRLL
jgi:hypothetical protein